MKKIFFVALCALALTSCTIYQYTGRDTAIQRQNIQATPTIVDVRADFNKRVSATSGWHRTQAEALAECNYLAITDNNIDIVVDPIYQIECRPHKMRNKYKASLTGFGGFYVNSRTPMEDMNQIKNFTREEIENWLLLHGTEILPYLYQPQYHDGDAINIYSGGPKPCCKKKECAAQPEAPAPAAAPAEQPAPKQAGKPAQNNAKKKK